MDDPAGPLTPDVHCPTGPAPAPGRGLRADAVRNREELLRVGRSLFASCGGHVGVEEIARAAGVGKGTLYRHFPSKDAFLTAVLEHCSVELEEAARTAVEDEDPARGFRGFLRWAAARQAADTGFYEVMASDLPEGLVSSELAGRMLRTVGAVLTRAQAAGVVRADLRVEELPVLMRMVGAAARPMRSLPGEPPSSERVLALLLEGLCPSPRPTGT